MPKPLLMSMRPRLPFSLLRSALARVHDQSAYYSSGRQALYDTYDVDGYGIRLQVIFVSLLLSLCFSSSSLSLFFSSSSLVVLEETGNQGSNNHGPTTTDRSKINSFSAAARGLPDVRLATLSFSLTPDGTPV
mmetsp:Transcript_10020/g.27241  ORF Transcript_10020/g.27241 Transcript_10020/m.27241 type:complete len:133 (+) Transcript_10020:276-674(+)